MKKVYNSKFKLLNSYKQQKFFAPIPSYSKKTKEDEQEEKPNMNKLLEIDEKALFYDKESNDNKSKKVHDFDEAWDDRSNNWD